MSKTSIIFCLLLCAISFSFSQIIPYELISDTLNSYTGKSKIDKAIEIGNSSDTWVIERVIMPELKSDLSNYNLFSYYTNELKQDSLKDMLRIISLSFLNSSILIGDSTLFLSKAEVYNSLLLQLYQNSTVSDSLRCYALGKMMYLPDSEVNKNFNLKDNLLIELNNPNELLRNAAIKTLSRNYDNLFITDQEKENLAIYLINTLRSKSDNINEYLPFMGLLSMIPHIMVSEYLDELIVIYYNEGDFLANEEILSKLIISKAENLPLIAENNKSISTINEFIVIFNVIDIESITYYIKQSLLSYVKKNEYCVNLIRNHEEVEYKLAYLKSIQLLKSFVDYELDRSKTFELINDTDLYVKINAILALPYLFTEKEVVSFLTTAKSTETNEVILELIGQFIGY